MSGYSATGPLVVLDNNMHNLIVAVQTRVFNHKVDGVWSAVPRPKLEVYKRDFLLLQLFEYESVAPLTADEFLQVCPPEKKAIYKSANESLESQPLARSDGQVNPFVKVEKSQKGPKERIDPRVIQARPPRFHAVWGRYIIPLKEKILGEIDRVFPGERTIMKGLNAVQVAQYFRTDWEHFVDPVAILLDASRFDQHVSVSAMQKKHAVYLRYLRNMTGNQRREFWLCAQAQLNTQAKARKGDKFVKYKSKGGLCSGDYDTDLTACLIVCMLFYEWLTTIGIDWRFKDNGDDCVVMCERKDVKKFEDGFMEFTRTFGFFYRIDDIVDVFEKIKFCQCNPVYDAHYDRWVMTRDPKNVLRKDLLILKSGLTFEQECGIYKAIAEGGLSLYGDMPLYHRFYGNMYDHYMFSKKPRMYNPGYNMEYLQKGVRVARRPPSLLTRESFYRAFDITPGQQVEMENGFRPFHHDSYSWELREPPQCAWDFLE